jgi:hypothetical protein
MASTFGEVLSKPLTDSLADLGRSSDGNKEENIKELAYKAFIVCQEQNILVEAWLPEQVNVDINANYDTPFAQGLGTGMPNLGSIARFAGISLTTQALTIQVWQGGSYIQFSLPLIFQAQSSGVTDVMKPIKDLMKLMMPKDPQGGGLLEAPGPRLDPQKVLNSGGVTDVLKIGANAVSDVTSTLMDAGKTIFSGGGAGGALSTLINGAVKTANDVAKPVSNAIVNSVKNNISLYIGQFQYFPSVVVTDVSPTFDVVLGPDKNPLRATVVVQFRTFYTPTERDIESMFPSAQEGSSGSGLTGFGNARDALLARSSSDAGFGDSNV